MILRGTVKSFEEYAEKYAEVFEMLSEGVLETRMSMDIDEEIERMREEVKKITNNT